MVNTRAHATRRAQGRRWRAPAALVTLVWLLIGCTSSGLAVPISTAVGTTSTPGTALPSEAACAQSVPVSTHEQRPSNRAANNSVPTAAQIAGLSPWSVSQDFSAGADDLRKRITGNYTGTTDMIIQWVACVWGIDPNIIRAQVDRESNWYQSSTGDLTPEQVLCPPGATRQGSSCFQSYGLLQVKWYYNQSAWPMSRDDSAFNLEYSYGLIRSCYEGMELWLGYGGTNYRAGDLWGCLGAWFSGGWHDAEANTYIAAVQQAMTQHPWTNSGF